MKEKFSVHGMNCAACVANVEKCVVALEGVKECQVSLMTNSMTVVYDENTLTNQQITEAVARAGYGASRYVGEDVSVISELKSAERALKTRIVCSVVLLVVLMYFSMAEMLALPTFDFFKEAKNALWFSLFLLALTVPIIWLNRAYYVSGFKHLVKRTPNMDTLIAIGSCASLAYGVVNVVIMMFATADGDLTRLVALKHNLYFEAAAMILTLVTLGKYIEGKSKRRTGDAVTSLMNLAPKFATVIRDGQEIVVPSHEVVLGDEVVVKAGESISGDGVVVRGECHVDESMLTGESRLVKKAVGAQISGGTICRSGYAVIRVNRTGEETALAKIVALVEEASTKKAPAQKLADKIAGVFVPVVIGISLITLVVWWIATDFETAFNFAVSVLVISCPCALGLATPVSLTVGLGIGAKNGILVKSGEALEKAGHADVVILDKTGTLTVGTPKVTEVIALGSKEEMLALAAAVEKFSEHPLAKAVVEHVCDGVQLEVVDFETVAGKGVQAVVDGKVVRVGNFGYLGEFCDTSALDARASTLEKQGSTVFGVASEDQLLGLIAVSDEIRPESRDAVASLKKFAKVRMLTGDGEGVASHVANLLDIDEFKAGVLPEDKARCVSEARSEGKVVFVGDGINDAPALASADVGVAIGAGTDVAIDSADVVLTGSNPSSLTTLVRLGKATMKKVRQNLFWAFAYNVLGIPLAAGVLFPVLGLKLSPMIGSVAMSLSSICVVTNALLLKLFKDKSQEKTKGEDKNMNEIVIKVEGMMCPHCASRVEGVVATFDGLTGVVNLDAKTVTVTAEKEFDLGAVKSAIVSAGYKVID